MSSDEEINKVDVLKTIAKKLATYSKSLQENYENMLNYFKDDNWDSYKECYKYQSNEYSKAINKARENVARMYGIVSGVVNSNLFKEDNFRHLNSLLKQIQDVTNSLLNNLYPKAYSTSCYSNPIYYSSDINTLQGLIDTIVALAGLELSEALTTAKIEDITSLLERVNLLEKKIKSIEDELIPLIKELHSLLKQYQRSLKEEKDDLISVLEKLDEL